MPFNGPFWSPSEASAVLFDWDGVIAETKLDFSGIREKYYGGRRAMLLEDASTLDEERRASLMRDLEDLEMEGAYNSTPVPGIFEILKWVEEKKIPWAVVSRNCRRSIIAAAERIGLGLPDIVRSRDDGDCVKPDPRALLETCASLGVPARQSLFIGDFLYDMIGARRTGMRGVLVRGSIEPEWSQWLECSYTSMADFHSELISPSKMIPWEYKDTADKFGRDFLAASHSICLRVPPDAKPDIPSWVLTACALGVGSIEAPAGNLEPNLWRKNRAFETAYMGKDMKQVLREFLSARYPLVEVVSEESRASIEAPDDSSLLEIFLLVTLRTS